MKLTLTRRQELILLWSMLTIIAITIFWSIWYLIVGNVPVVSSFRLTPNWTYILPYSISRWWDILIGPIWTTLVFYLITNERFKKDEEFFGLFIGLFIGLTIELSLGWMLGIDYTRVFRVDYDPVVGVGFGLVFIFVFGWIFGLIISFFTSKRLVFGLSCGLGLGLICGICFGLIHGLGFGLIYGMGIGLIYGITYGLIFGLISLLRIFGRLFYSHKIAANV